MERKKASDFPQELLNLFDGYVHGGISRRQFLDGAQKFAVGGVTYLHAPGHLFAARFLRARTGPQIHARSASRLLVCLCK